jgi:hypothetical protein
VHAAAFAAAPNVLCDSTKDDENRPSDAYRLSGNPTHCSREEGKAEKDDEYWNNFMMRALTRVCLHVHRDK